MGESEGEKKLLKRSDLVNLRHELDAQGRKLVLTNGCFDILHDGHRRYLEEAAAVGDLLAVAVNSDRSVRQLKGPSRPLRKEEWRIEALGALPFVQAIVVFDEAHVTALLEEVMPHIYVKGGDYTIETIDQDLRSALERHGIAVRFLAFVEGVSTTNLIKSMDPATEEAVRKGAVFP